MYQITEQVFYDIKHSLYLPEMGGILGINAQNIISEFYWDISGKTLKHQYIPDVDKLNEVIYEWSLKGISFIGFVHSHPCNKPVLSSIDIKYANKIKESSHLNEILMLLYIPGDDDFFQYIV